jgi:hypothetical protein
VSFHSSSKRRAAGSRHIKSIILLAGILLRTEHPGVEDLRFGRSSSAEQAYGPSVFAVCFNGVFRPGFVMYSALGEIHITGFDERLEIFGLQSLALELVLDKRTDTDLVRIELHEDAVLRQPGGKGIVGTLFHDAKPDNDATQQKAK